MKSHVLRTVYTGQARADLVEGRSYLEVMKRNAKDSYVDYAPRPTLAPVAKPMPSASVNPVGAASAEAVASAPAMTAHVPWTAYALTAAICLALLLLGLTDYAENFLRSLVQ